MNAYDFLNQPRRIEDEIEKKREQVELWQSIATSTTAQMGGERVQTSGNQQKMASAVEKCVDIKSEILELEAEKQRAISDIIGIIEKLSPTEFTVIFRTCLNYYSLREIADEKGKSYAWAKGVKRRAVRKVQKLLDEGEKENEWNV